MADTLIAPEPRRELAHRVSGGISVTLYWDVEEDSTSVEIFDDATEQTLHFDVPRACALDAFYHPFAHAGTEVRRRSVSRAAHARARRG